jgi:hypothetical protein
MEKTTVTELKLEEANKPGPTQTAPAYGVIRVAPL